MGDKRFTDKNWDEATKKYNLNFLVLPNDKSDKSRDSEDTEYGESIDLEFSDEDQNDSDNEDDQKESTPTKYSKGKHKATEDNSQEYNMEIENEYGRSMFVGGLTEDECKLGSKLNTCCRKVITIAALYGFFL
ncbi:hypothetical protein O181_076930 [Austropuccinia psidii MF-1]|uniref:Uncharacterized protein n=1 Tax=Austropuccinia psidii MF-1 TaxID=1389203 RepID=A0A9Q3FH55_9BASI|nr:hypothetical protein [Austropuccinia psidii MF-1]